MQEFAEMSRELQDFGRWDSLDHRIVAALELQPRLSWSQVGAELGVDPVTVGRRWRRLSDAGAAWVTCYPLLAPRSVAAMIEIVCLPTSVDAVAAELMHHPNTILIAATTGPRDLLVTVVAEDWDALSTYVHERLQALSGVRQVAAHPIVSHHTGGFWRVDALNASEREAFTLPASPLQLSSHEPTDLDWRIADALAKDGRSTARQVAAEVGTSETTARRRIDQLLATGCLRLRCDVARPLATWPLDAWFFAQLPANKLSAVGAALGGLRQFLQVTSTTGHYNLIFAVAMKSPEQAQSLEAQLTNKIPNLTIIDRSVSLRIIKLMSWILDKRGYAEESVALDYRLK